MINPEHFAGAQDPAGTMAGVAVWSPDPETSQTAREFAYPCIGTDDVFVFSGQDWPDVFRAFCANVGAKGYSQILATELTRDKRFVPWKSVALDTMAHRVDTPWLPSLLQDEAIVAHFQPLANVVTGCIEGYEALARGFLDERALNGGEILEAARAHGALKDFDALARSKAIGSAGLALSPTEKIFVNILPSTFGDFEADLAPFWDAAHEWDVDPSRIVLEVLESDEMPSMSELSRLVAHVHSMGALIALDDVGAGHSSLVHISELQPDIVKFDRGLLPLEPTDAHVSLLVGLCEYAHSHGCLTVAEGVETDAQMDLVKYCRFDLAQGWLIGRPRPPRLDRARLASAVVGMRSQFDKFTNV